MRINIRLDPMPVDIPDLQRPFRVTPEGTAETVQRRVVQRREQETEEYKDREYHENKGLFLVERHHDVKDNAPKDNEGRRSRARVFHRQDDGYRRGEIQPLPASVRFTHP